MLGMRGVGFFVLAAGLGLAAAIGCGDGKDGTRNAKLPEGVRSQAIEHEGCTEGGHKVEQVDVNNDGKPDIKRIFDGNHEICRISDLNRDGKLGRAEVSEKMPRLADRFAWLDDNRDGFLTRAELQEGRHH